MVLDRASGAILKTSGQISSIRKAKPQPQQPEQSEPVTDQQGPLSPSFPPGTTTDTTTTDAGAAPGTAVTTTGEEAVAAQPTMVSSGTGMDGDVPGAGAGAGAAAAGARSASTSGSNAVSAYDQNVVELAAMVWSFVSNAGEFVQELDGEVSSRRFSFPLFLTQFLPKILNSRWNLGPKRIGSGLREKLKLTATCTGRVEAPTTTNEKAGTSNRARCEIPACRLSRYSPGMMS